MLENWPSFLEQIAPARVGVVPYVTQVRGRSVVPLVQVKSSAVKAGVKRIPTSTTLVVLPMTVDRIGHDLASLDDPTGTESLQDAFDEYQPRFTFRTLIGPQDREFIADLRFRTLADFDPASLVRPRTIESSEGEVQYLRNDIADVQTVLELLYRFRERWALPSFGRAWTNEAQRLYLGEALKNIRRFALEPVVRTSAQESSADHPHQPDSAQLSVESAVVFREMLADLSPIALKHPRVELALRDKRSADLILQCLDVIESNISVEDSYELSLNKLENAIKAMECTRDAALRELCDALRPLERSYRELALFWTNTSHELTDTARVRLYIVNADTNALSRSFDLAVESVQRFVEARNDNFNFRDDICNLVAPGFLRPSVREEFEKLADRWGLLFITDLDDERSVANAERNFGPMGKYEFLKRREEQSAASVVTMNYLELRPSYHFERDAEGLYGPASIAFAGALARTDATEGLAQGPVGSRFGRIFGTDGCRFDPRIGEMERLSMQRQIIPVIRDADNHLCFYGCRTLADDPYGVLKFFTSYRIIRFIERCCRHYLLGVAGQVLTREFMEQSIELPLNKLLNEQIEGGAILSYNLFVDKSSDKRKAGVCDIKLEISPVTPGETLVLQIDVPRALPEQ